MEIYHPEKPITTGVLSPCMGIHHHGGAVALHGDIPPSGTGHRSCEAAGEKFPGAMAPATDPRFLGTVTARWMRKSTSRSLLVEAVWSTCEAGSSCRLCLNCLKYIGRDRAMFLFSNHHSHNHKFLSTVWCGRAFSRVRRASCGVQREQLVSIFVLWSDIRPILSALASMPFSVLANLAGYF